MSSDEKPADQLNEEARHNEWLLDFRRAFARAARKALRDGADPDEWPFVLARVVDWSPDPDALAEFAAGVLISPTPKTPLEPWLVRGVLYRTSRGPAIVGDLSVEHFPLAQKTTRAEVTGTVLRGVPLGREIRNNVLAGLRGLLQAREEVNETRGIPGERLEAARRAVRESGTPKRGRPGKPDEHYRHIAERYLELVKTDRNVLVVLAAEESKRQGRQIPRETIRDWVRKATVRGYLAPGKPGKAEARPGAKLKRKEK